MLDKKTKLSKIANELRKETVTMIYKAQSGHLGSSLSEIDILTALYFSVMNTNQENLNDIKRDRFVLSKGHGSEGLYCTLQKKGFFPHSWLENYHSNDNPLTNHPTNKVPGIEVCTGALGHGFSVGVGMALSAKLKNYKNRTFILTGDGELQEGTNWEAAMAASQFKLGNLVWIIDQNQLQLYDKVSNTMEIEPLKEKIESFGFIVSKVDGNNPDEISTILNGIDYTGNKPHALIAKTVKGKGVSFMENIAEWHHRIPNKEEWEIAMKELGNE